MPTSNEAIHRITDTADNIRATMTDPQIAISTTTDATRNIDPGTLMHRLGGSFYTNAISTKIDATTGVAVPQDVTFNKINAVEVESDDRFDVTAPGGLYVNGVIVEPSAVAELTSSSDLQALIDIGKNVFYANASTGSVTIPGATYNFPAGSFYFIADGFGLTLGNGTIFNQTDVTPDGPYGLVFSGKVSLGGAFTTQNWATPEIFENLTAPINSTINSNTSVYVENLNLVADLQYLGGEVAYQYLQGSGTLKNNGGANVTAAQKAETRRGYQALEETLNKGNNAGGNDIINVGEVSGNSATFDSGEIGVVTTDDARYNSTPSLGSALDIPHRGYIDDRYKPSSGSGVINVSDGSGGWIGTGITASGAKLVAGFPDGSNTTVFATSVKVELSPTQYLEVDSNNLHISELLGGSTNITRGLFNFKKSVGDRVCITETYLEPGSGEVGGTRWKVTDSSQGLDSEVSLRPYTDGGESLYLRADCDRFRVTPHSSNDELDLYMDLPNDKAVIESNKNIELISESNNYLFRTSGEFESPKAIFGNYHNPIASNIMQIGNGTSDVARSNALEVNSGGNFKFYTKTTTELTGQQQYDAGDKQLLSKSGVSHRAIVTGYTVNFGFVPQEFEVWEDSLGYVNVVGILKNSIFTTPDLITGLPARASSVRFDVVTYYRDTTLAQPNNAIKLFMLESEPTTLKVEAIEAIASTNFDELIINYRYLKA